jgi:pimeloyl-ACP methyl ester carboxylesterase
MPKIESQGVELFYETRGEGPPIVFHHAHTGTHAVWDEVVARLCDRHRCVSLDARGVGQSDRPEHGYGIEQLASDVVGLVDALGIDRFTYVGHSLGGLVGFELGLEHGARLERLVLVSPGPADGMALPAELQARALQTWRAKDRDAMLRERRSVVVRACGRERLAEALERSLEVSEGHFAGCLAAACAYRKGERLHEIATPTMMVAGAADGLLAANLQDFARLGHATLHVFSRVGHAAPREVPAELAEVIADFIAHGVVAARRSPRS